MLNPRRYSLILSAFSCVDDDDDDEVDEEDTAKDTTGLGPTKEKAKDAGDCKTTNRSEASIRDFIVVYLDGLS